MKNKFALWTLSFLIFIALSCTNNQDSVKNSTDSTKVENLNNESDKLSSNMDENITSDVFNLLQGKWQHTEDKTNFLVFENNHRKEIVEGMDNWDDEVFVLSGSCKNESNKDNEVQIENDKYISCVESDLCWYIVSIDKDNLSLSYVGRGNTLTYRRVN